MSNDQNIDSGIRCELRKSVCQLYRCAFFTAGYDDQSIAAEMLREASNQAGL